MKNNQPKVSIIAPSYNSEQFISLTIDSVLSQSYKDWEMIIVDDCSTDNTTIIVENYIKKYPEFSIELIKNNSNLGPALTRNRAIEKAKGRFIAFLDTDDLWKPNKLEVQLRFMKENNYKFTCSYFSQIDENNSFIKNVTDIPSKISYNNLLTANRVGCLTAIYDTEYFGKVLMDNIKKRQDFALWLKLLKKIDYVYCTSEILAEYRVRNNSVSSNKFKLVKYHWFIYKDIEKLGVLKSFVLTIVYIYKTLNSKL